MHLFVCSSICANAFLTFYQGRRKHIRITNDIELNDTILVVTDFLDMYFIKFIRRKFSVIFITVKNSFFN